MPAKYRGSWDPKTSRWMKMYRGRRFAVSVKQLGEHFRRQIPATKEGSYQFFNAWLDEKQQEIDKEAAPPPTPFPLELDECRRRRDWCREHGDEAGALAFEALLKQTADLPALKISPIEVDRRIRAHVELDQAGLGGASGDPGEIAPVLIDKLSGEEVWVERLGKPKAPAAKSLQALAEGYIALKRGKVQRSELSAGGLVNIQGAVGKFVQFLGPSSPASVIDEDRWAAYCRHVVGLGYSATYCSRLMGFTRGFVDHLYEQGKIERPRNLNSRDLRVAVAAPVVETVPADLIRSAFEVARGECRLHILLALNCGMTQRDISDLHPSEVDWTQGRVFRQRSKTRGNDAVPEVDYKLWPVTMALLKEHRTEDPEHVLLTARGEPWVVRDLVEGGVVKGSDKLGKYYEREVHRRGVATGPFKLLRKTSASMLDNHAEYGRYAQYFLGHSPGDMASRHYVKPSRERFDEAVAWLHDQYFPARGGA